MTGLDTNVIVRYLTQDDDVQSALATNVIERVLTPSKPGFISVVAIVETAWVLERAYGVASDELAMAIERLLQTDVLIIECEQEVFAAMIDLKEQRATFSDAVIGALGTKAGLSHTLTFDKKAARLKHFMLLG